MIIELTAGTAATDVPFYKQERFVVKFITNASTVMVYEALSGLIATYKTTGGVLYVDLTDYLRAYENVNAIRFVEVGVAGYTQIKILRKGLINPNDDWLNSVLQPTYKTEIASGFLSKPPERMIMSDDYDFGKSLRAEIIYTGTTPKIEYSRNGSVWWYSCTISGSAIVIPFNAIAIRIKLQGENAGWHVIKLQEKECQKYYWMLQWISKTGNLKRHVWEVRNFNFAAADAYSLEALDNAFKTIKGREEDVKFRLENLSPYDYLYYSDIITSSRVEVVWNTGEQTGSEIVWPIEVKTNKIAIPNGDFPSNNIEIECKIKRYDAVAL